MRNLIPSILFIALLCAAAPSRAEFPSESLYIGVNGGATFILKDMDLRANTDGGEKPNTLGNLGVRLGFHFLPWFAAEGEFTLLPTTSNIGKYNTLLAYDLDLLFHLMTTDWAPTADIGFGAYQSAGGDLGADIDPRFHVGLGVRGLLNSWMALRADVRDVISDGISSGGSNGLELTVGLDFFVWQAASKSEDRDNDGIVDKDDACPDNPGPASTQGCPDKDGDGVADKDDQCPDDKGPAVLHGCPDKDGDGIADKDDECPDQAGVAELKGCPDADGDGVADKDDKCPKEKGLAAFDGCPDTDGDGIPDKDDRCPKEKGSEALRGCPDRDGDGVADKDDQCPDEPGPRENKGCMPEEAKKFVGAIKGINFALGSAKITKSSYPLLDEAVALLKQYASMHLAIEGHTDNTGKPEKNMTLSQDRADAVRDYLVQKGVEAERFESKGYGETRPLNENKTAKDRAANRRIEFHISTQ
jgi:outer membrane protein OmpA-like peptidoglycan-associated protein